VPLLRDREKGVETGKTGEIGENVVVIVVVNQIDFLTGLTGLTGLADRPPFHIEGLVNAVLDHRTRVRLRFSAA
jgi:hypothetical protein